MPYHVEPVHGGFYVVGPEGRKSKEPLTLERAHAQMRALYANVPESRPVRTDHVKPLQIQKRQAANDQDADDKPVGRARGGKVNLSGKQKSKKKMPPVPPEISQMTAGAGAPVGPGATPGAGAPGMAPPIGPDGQPLPGFKSGGSMNFIQKAVKPSRKGVFKAKAKAAGKTTAEYANEESGAPGKLGAEARLAQTLMHLRNRK